MLQDDLIKLFERDLNQLISEIDQYPDEADLWLKPEGIKNSAGSLAFHIIGNLNHFIGSVLGDTGYQRDRAAEFDTREVPRLSIISDLNATGKMIRKVLGELTDERLQETFPVQVFEQWLNTTYFLIHLHGHLNYHLGQVNYHRRLLVS